MKRKKIVIITLVAILMNLFSINTFAMELSDIKGHWAEAYIIGLTDSGIISGYPDQTFRPDNSLSRAEFLTLVMKINAGGEDIPGSSNGHWAEKYYSKAIGDEIITEELFTLNQLDDDLTRLEMSIILSNMLGIQEGFEENLKVIPKDIDKLSESDMIYRGSLLNVYANGLISGYPDGEFKPYNSLSRAEGSVVLVRYILEEYRVDTQSASTNQEQVTVENEIEQVNLTSASELVNYLNNNYSELETSIGKTTFNFKIYENYTTFSEEDYWLMVGYDSTLFYNVLYSNQISREDREKVKEELKQHQKNIAESIIKNMPDKKVIGGYYDSWYRYPTLRVDLISRRYYTWTNYDQANFMLDEEAYYQATPSSFRWYSLMDDDL